MLNNRDLIYQDKAMRLLVKEEAKQKRRVFGEPPKNINALFINKQPDRLKELKESLKPGGALEWWGIKTN